MAKRFNITGTCIPDRHYMVDASARLKQIIEMIENGDYFTINRPRQYGKTTTMFLLDNVLSEDDSFTVLRISFEGVGGIVFENEQNFCEMLIKMLEKEFDYAKQHVTRDFISNLRKSVFNLEELSELITAVVKQQTKQLVLMIDEVDSSSNNDLFVRFIGMLRDKFLKRNEGRDHTFQSVILAGVHDVKTLKMKIGSGTDQKHNSPWDIAADFEVDMSFDSNEIAEMLKDYKQDKKVEIDTALLGKQIHYFTSGYPFLVSRLCKTMDEKILPQKEEHSLKTKDLEKAVNILLKDAESTNFQSLIKNLEDNPELYDLVERILLVGERRDFNRDNKWLNYGAIHGILASENGKTKIHNRIYEERIYNYMVSNLLYKGRINRGLDRYNFSNDFFENDGLNMEKVLLRFQAFMKEQFSAKDDKFIERHGRLVF
jgi:hypothetical protein